mgnify:CR=1 FL=1
MHTGINVVKRFLHGEKSKQESGPENIDTNSLNLIQDFTTISGKEIVGILFFIELKKRLLAFKVGLKFLTSAMGVALIIEMLANILILVAFVII